MDSERKDSDMSEDGATIGRMDDGKTKSVEVIPEESTPDSVEGAAQHQSSSGVQEAPMPVHGSFENSDMSEDGAATGRMDDGKTKSVEVNPEESTPDRLEETTQNQSSSGVQEAPMPVHGSFENSDMSEDGAATGRMDDGKTKSVEVNPEESTPDRLEETTQNQSSSGVQEAPMPVHGSFENSDMSEDGAATGRMDDGKTKSVEVNPEESTPDRLEETTQNQSSSGVQEAPMPVHGSFENSDMSEDGAATGRMDDGKTKSVEVNPEESTPDRLEETTQNQSSSGVQEAPMPVHGSFENSDMSEDGAATGRMDDGKTKSVELIPEESTRDSLEDSTLIQLGLEIPEASISVEASSADIKLTGGAAESERIPESIAGGKTESADRVPEKSVESSTKNHLDYNSIVDTDTLKTVDGPSLCESPIQCDVISKETGFGSSETSVVKAVSDSAEIEAPFSIVENTPVATANNDSHEVDRPAGSSTNNSISVVDWARTTEADTSSSSPGGIIKEKSIPVGGNPSITQITEGTPNVEGTSKNAIDGGCTSNEDQSVQLTNKAALQVLKRKDDRPEVDRKRMFKDVKWKFIKMALLFCAKRKIPVPRRAPLQHILSELYRLDKLDQKNLEIRLMEESLRNPRSFIENSNKVAVAVENMGPESPQRFTLDVAFKEVNVRYKEFREIAVKYCKAKKLTPPPERRILRILHELALKKKLNEDELKTCLNRCGEFTGEQDQALPEPQGEILPPVVKKIFNMPIDEQTAALEELKKLEADMKPIAVQHCHKIKAPFPHKHFNRICLDLFEVGMLEEQYVKLGIEMAFEDSCKRPLTNDEINFVLKRYCKDFGIVLNQRNTNRAHILSIIPKNLLTLKNFWSLLYKLKKINLFTDKTLNPGAAEKSVEVSNISNTANKGVPNSSKPPLAISKSQTNFGGAAESKVTSSGKKQRLRPCDSNATKQRDKVCAIDSLWPNTKTSQFKNSPMRYDGGTSNSLNSGAYPTNSTASNTQGCQQGPVQFRFQTDHCIAEKAPMLGGLGQRSNRPRRRYRSARTKLRKKFEEFQRQSGNRQEGCEGGNLSRNLTGRPLFPQHVPDFVPPSPPQATGYFVEPNIPSHEAMTADRTSNINIVEAHGRQGQQTAAAWSNEANRQEALGQESRRKQSRSPKSKLRLEKFKERLRQSGNRQERCEEGNQFRNSPGQPLFPQHLSAFVPIPSPIADRTSNTNIVEAHGRQGQQTAAAWSNEANTENLGRFEVPREEYSLNSDVGEHSRNSESVGRSYYDVPGERTIKRAVRLVPVYQNDKPNSQKTNKIYWDDDGRRNDEATGELLESKRLPPPKISPVKALVNEERRLQNNDDPSSRGLQRGDWRMSRRFGPPVKKVRFAEDRQSQAGRSADYQRVGDDFHSRFSKEEHLSSRPDKGRVANNFQNQIVPQDKQPRHSHSADLQHATDEFDQWMTRSSKKSSESLPSGTSNRVPWGRTSPPSVAEQQTSVMKENPPFVPHGRTCKVAIVPVDYPESKITEQEADLIRSELLGRIGVQHGAGPRFVDTYEERGAVVFECADHLTVSWVWANASTIQPWRTTSYRPTSWEKPPNEISIQIPKILQNLTPQAFCERLMSQNPGLSTGSWKLKLTDFTSWKFVFYIDDDSMDILKSLDLRPYLGFSRVNVDVIQD